MTTVAFRSLPSDFGCLPMSNWPTEVKPFEPVYGWMQRAARENYALSADSFVCSLGLNGRDWDFEELLEVASGLPLRSFPSLEWNTPKRAGTEIEICGHRLPQQFFTRSERRVCPKCLSESRHIQVWFDIRLIAACPFHDVALIGGLEDDPIDWRNPEVGYTRSGVKISSEHSSSLAASIVDHFVVRSLQGIHGPRGEHLTAEELAAVLQAAICVGKLFEGHVRQESVSVEYRRLAQIGLPPLLEGQDAITNLLEKAPWLSTGRRRGRYQTQCENARYFLKRVTSTKLRRLLQESFALARVRSRTATPAGTFSRFDGEDGSWTLKRVASSLGLGPDVVRRILGELSSPMKQCSHTRAFRITAEQVTAIRRYVESCWTGQRLAQALGCEVSDVLELVHRRLLKPAFRRGAVHHFRPATVDAFVTEVLNTGEFREGSDGNARAMKCFARQADVSIANVCSWIIRKHAVAALSHDPAQPFFDGLKVRYVELPASRIAARRLRPKAQIRDATTFAAAAARIGTSSNGLKKLIETSFIKTVSDKRGRKRICEKSLRAFEGQYVRAALLAPALHCAPRNAAKILRSAGVEVINEWTRSGPKIVSREDARRRLGIDVDPASGLEEWRLLLSDLGHALALATIPATRRLNCQPSIVVTATTGRWSFKIEHAPQSEDFQLVAKFGASSEPSRLKRIMAAAVVPGDIWPCSKVVLQSSGGFHLVDRLSPQNRAHAWRSDLVQHIITRAHQLHQLL